MPKMVEQKLNLRYARLEQPMEGSLLNQRNFTATLFFLSFAPFVVALSFLALSFKAPAPQKQENPVRIFSSLPEEYPSVSLSFAVEDARVPIIRAYLKKYNSPLVAHAEKLVSEADKNELDFRLLTAIARQESNLCKFIPEDSYNCWGWGIHKSGTLGFESYDQAIEVVSLGLKQKYIDKGYKTPEEIMSKYTPHSNGSWANGVTQFMEDLE